MKKLLSKFCVLPLWDRCMMIVMVILLIECAYILIFEPPLTPVNNTIDSVIKATILSLFGFFLSANFLQKQRKNTRYMLPKFEENLNNNNEENIHDIIGFVTGESEQDKVGDVQNYEDEPEVEDHYWIVRVKVVASITIFSLFVLIMVRNFAIASESVSSYITMFKDIVSGGIGFLIGYVPVLKTSE